MGAFGVPKLDERGRRLFAAAEARTAGWGGLAMVSKITRLARSTINRGEDDLDTQPLLEGRVRRAGGGRRALCDTDPGLIPALKRLVQPATLGDPMRPLIWVSKSLDKLAAALTEMGHPIGPDTVRKELVKLGFSRQSNRKADECERRSKSALFWRRIEICARNFPHLFEHHRFALATWTAYLLGGAERSSPKAAGRRAIGAGLDGECAYRAIIEYDRDSPL